jgi:hypothetical protein
LEKIMADNEATRALFRELLGMTGGANASGRGKMDIPTDIMDSLAGDAAQDALAKDRLIMEMRNAESRAHDPRFVSLDLMNMDPTNVEAYLAEAATKMGGGVMDQDKGPVGGEVDSLTQKRVRDRGKKDPIGDVDSVAEAEERPDPLRNLGPSLMTKEGWAAREAAAKKAGPEAWKRFQYLKRKRSPGGKDSDIGLPAGVEPYKEDSDEWVDEATAMALQRGGFADSPMPHLDPDEAMRKLKSGARRTWKKAKKWLKGDPDKSKKDKAEESYEETEMHPSRTAFALSNFMESSHNAYAAANAGGGKGSPGELLRKQDYAGDMSRKERDDNKDYPTELMPAKSGGKRTAGEPGSLSTRGVDRGDPIGEAVAAPAPERGGPGDEGPSGVIPGPRKKGMPGKPKLPMGGRMKGLMKSPTQPGPRPTNRMKGSGPSPEALQRMFKSSGQRPQMNSVENDGPVISETAFALANFMDAYSQASVAKEKLALGKGDAGELGQKQRGDTRENLGSPLEKASGKRGGLSVYDDGGKKARYEKDANPIGGAVPGEQGGRRMKK